MTSDSILDIARQYVAGGLSVVPIKADCSKAAKFKWDGFRDRMPTDQELKKWFTSNENGLAIVCGAISGNLAVVDIETESAWESWREAVIRRGLETALKRCPIVKTPRGGRHVYCRIEEGFVPGGKLAMASNGETVIEVRGQGNYVLAPGCPAACHPTGKLYELIQAAWLDGDAATVPLADFESMCDAARELNEYATPERVRTAPNTSTDVKGDRPGDFYNRRVLWADILVPAGWKVDHTSGATTYWTRPGKASGVSATTGRCKSEMGGDLLYVFSSNAVPFESETAYDKFVHTHFSIMVGTCPKQGRN